MAKAPGARYQSTKEMLADLQAFVAALSTIVLPSDSGGVPAKPAEPSLPPSGRSPDVCSNSERCSSASRGRRPRLVWAAIAMGGLAVGIGRFFGRPAFSGGATRGTPLAPAPRLGGDIVLGMTAPFSGPSNELGREMEIGIRTYLCT